MTDDLDRALASLRAHADREWEDLVPHEPAEAPSVATPPVDADDQARVAARVAELAPWTQGPFPLPGGLVAGEAGVDRRRWVELAREVPDDLSGRRVLDVGCGAGYDCFEFARRGANHVLGCEWSRAIEQATFLEELYGTGTTFAPTAWGELDPDRHGTFDLVHCDGVLQRVPSPLPLLGRLWRMIAPGGELLLGSKLLDPPSLSRYTAFAATAAPGWVPGRLALRWMVECSGFEAAGWLGERPAAQSEPPTVSGYLRALRTDRRPAIG